MVSEGLLSPGWEKRPAEPREPGWRVLPGLGGSGGRSCLVLSGCLWARRQPLKNFTPWTASVQGIGSGTMLRNNPC